MKKGKRLGTACANCRSIVDLVEAAAKERAAEIALEKVEVR
jgi:hypothetical protein